jgi:hypothetical protein
MIIRELIRKGYCFAVMKSYSNLTKSKHYENPEYEILALMEDFRELQYDDFQTNQDTSECPVKWLNPDGVISRILESDEIREFHALKSEHFTKVFTDPKNGNVYELKKLSFREQYKKTNN